MLIFFVYGIVVTAVAVSSVVVVIATVLVYAIVTVPYVIETVLCFCCCNGCWGC